MRKSSTGKSYGTSGNKIGNAHLKWAFSEAAALFLRANEPAQKYVGFQEDPFDCDLLTRVSRNGQKVIIE